MPITVCQHAGPLVRALFDRAREERANLQQLSRMSGLTRETIGAWAHGREPIAANLEAVGNCQRLSLAWREDDD